MELPRRPAGEVYLADGTLTRLIDQTRRFPAVRELRIGIFYAFDYRTRMLPYYYADRRMAPAAVRTLADILAAAGFAHVRVVLQQWNPNTRPSACELDGKPLDIVMVSAMQVHAEPSYAAVRDACGMGGGKGPSRPLVLAGGPKAIYEPVDYLDIGPGDDVGADGVVTGEAFVLLELLNRLVAEHSADGSIRDTYHRLRRRGELDGIPGLVYLDQEDGRKCARHTGVQRLVRDLDEIPIPDAGYRLLERRIVVEA